MEFALLGDFEGAIHLRYNKVGMLMGFSIVANLNEKQYEWFMKNVPTKAHGLEAFVAQTSSMRIMSEKTVFTFDDFWQNYSKKKDQVRAVPKWFALKFFERVLAVVMCKAYDRELAKTKTAYLHPDGYLSKKRFLEVEI